MGFSIYEVRKIYSNYWALSDTNDPDVPSQISGDGVNPEVLLACVLTTDDIVPHVVELWRGGANTPTVKVLSKVLPASAGDGTVPKLDLLDGEAPVPIGLFLGGTSDQFFIFVRTAISSGTFVYLDPIIGTF
jgi:hypothetical protein